MRISLASSSKLAMLPTTGCGNTIGAALSPAGLSTSLRLACTWITSRRNTSMRTRLPLLVTMSQPGAAVAVAVAVVALTVRRLPSEAAASGAASIANVMASAAANACLRGV